MRIKKLLKNMFSEILPQILLALLGIIKSKILLQYLGENVLGLYYLYAQVLSYVSIVEGGLGSAAVYKMYKPIVEKNYQKIGELKNGIKKIFSILASIIILLGLCVSFIIPFLIKNNTFSTEYIVTNFIIYVISEIMLYFTVFERSMFIATESTYKLNRVLKTTLIFKSIIEILISIKTSNLTAMLVSFVIVNCIGNILIRIIANKEFDYISNVNKSDFSIMKDVKNLVVHKIAGLVSSNVDIMILSSFIGLGKVVIYSTYNLFTSTLISLITKISTAFLGTIGNIIVENKEKANQAFKEYNSFIFFIALTIGIPFLFSINSFINIWYSQQVQTGTGISFLFTLILVYGIIRIPLITFTEAGGLFKETKICAILEAIINLLLSLILVNFWKIEGLLFATFTSLIVSEFLIKPRIIYKNIFKKSSKEYYKVNLTFSGIIISMLIITANINSVININSLFDWFLYSAIFFIINAIISVIICIVLKQDYFLKRIKEIKN